MTLSTKINQGFTAVGTKVKELSLATVKSVNSVTPNSYGNVKITTITGNAGSATKLQTARTITLSGDVSGSVSFDGSEDVSITTTVADDSHNHTISNIDNLQTTLNAKAALASPTFTGTPKAPTATAGTNTTQIATTAFVTTAIANKTSVASATKATQDGSGNVITDTYLTKTDASNTYLGKTAKAASASSADSVAWGNVSGKPSSFTPASHNQASNTINALTGYSKPSSTSALSTSDTLNSALGKLEKSLDGKASTGSVTTALSDAKSYTDTKVAALVDSSPATLDTLNELAAALGDDPNFATTVATQIGTKANDSAVVKLTGNQTIGGTKTFSSTITGSVSGNAGTATKLATARTITLGGDASGSVSFDGSENKTLTVTVKDDSHAHVIGNVDGLQDALNAKADKENGIYFIDGTGTEAGVWLGTHTGISEYYQGLTIAYKLGIAGVSGGSTLNINGLGAIAVVRNNGSAITTHYGVGSILVLTYDIGSDTGTAYWKIADYDSDTKTRSSNKASTKMYIIGATTQSTSGQTTYSNSKCYIGTDNCLYSNGTKVSTSDTNTTYTLTKSGSSITLTGSDGSSTSVTDSDTNTTYSNATTSVAGLMSASDKSKLDGIASGANKYTHPSTHAASMITGLAAVATSGNYADLSNKPTSLPANGGNADTVGGFTVGVSVPSNAKFTDTVYTLPTAGSSLGGVKTTSTVTSTSGLTACPIINGVPYYKDTKNTYTLSSFSVTATASELNVLDGITASTTELNYVDGVTSNIQTQLNGKLSTSGTAAKATADASGNTITSTYATKTELTNGLAGKADSSHTHGYLPLSGGSLTGSITFGSDKGVGVKWSTRKNNGSVELNPFMGYCSNSGDGTFVVGSLLGTTYQTGLAIGGSSGNLLWKGAKILDSNNFSEFALSKSGTAVKATSDASGNNIANTYAKKSTIGDTTTNFVAYFEECMAS